MPIYHVVDGGRNLVHTVCQDVVTAQEFLEARAALAGDALFRPDMNQLVDMRKATSTALDDAAIRDIAARSIFAPGSKKALVASSDQVFSLARLYELRAGLAGGGMGNVRVFRDIDAAFSWLGIRITRSNGSV